MKLRALILDDEEPARNIIKHYLSAFENIEICGEFADGFTGAKEINNLKPDLIFLDIQMPKLTGFEVLEIIDYKPIIIFSTAYDQFAIKAFEANAIDYLLKPYSGERFNQAVNKAIEKFQSNEKNDNQIKTLIEDSDQNAEILERFAVKSGNKIHILEVNDIIFIESSDDYTIIHTNKDQFVKEKTMKYFESHLDNNKFIRIHRSYIVNVSEIASIEQYEKESYLVHLKNNKQLKASNSGYKILKQKFF